MPTKNLTKCFHWIVPAILLTGLFATVWAIGAQPERDETPDRPHGDGKVYRVQQAWLGWHDVEGKLVMGSNPLQPGVITLVLRNADGWLLDLAREQKEVRGEAFKPEELEALVRGEGSPEARQRFSSWYRDRLGDLRLVIAGQRFETIRPVDTTARGKQVGDDTWNAVVFRLRPESTEEMKWQEFIRLMGVRCSGLVTVALRVGDHWVSLRSEVNDAGLRGGRFRFNLRPALMSALAWTLTAGVLLLLVGLAAGTDVLRTDRPSGLSADQRAPWSLARVVLAWWLGICAATYLFLWAMTEELNVLSGSGPLLLGINGGTLLFSKFITARNRAAVGTEGPGNGSREAGTPVALPGGVAGGDGPGAQAGTPNRSATRGFFRDLISESGEPEVSRVQMLVWNGLFGLVFAWQTLIQWKMPTFDATLMTLLGVSATTYIGFKATP